MTVAAVPAPEPVPPTPARSPWLGVLAWSAVALLLVLEYGVFRSHVEREVAWRFPGGYDQAVYLTNSYDFYEDMRANGVWSGGVRAVRRPTPNGAVLEVEAALLYHLLGPSRLSALTLNFFYYSLLQIALAGTLRWYTGRWSAASLGLGLLLAAGTHCLVEAGWLTDFRLDFSAFCLFGIFLCIAARSGAFLSWRWSLAAGPVAAVLVLTRHVTAVYLAGIFVAYFTLLVAWLCLRRKDPAARGAALRRLGGLVLAGLVLAALAGPVVWYKWPAMRAYYLGQFERGEGPVREQEYGGVGLLGRLLFYARMLGLHQTGPVFLMLAGLLFLAALLARRSWRGQAGGALPPPAARWGRATPLFAGLCLFVPLTVLTLFGAPSPVVGGIVVVPLVWLVALGILRLLRSGSAAAAREATVLGLLALVGGFACHAGALLRSSHYSKHRVEYEEVGKLYDRIGAISRQNGWTAPRVTFNTLSEHLWPGAVASTVYERQGLVLSPESLIGGGLSPVSEDQALAAVRQSDFAVLAAADGVGDGNPLYPFVRCMREFRPRMLAECEKTHIPVQRFTLLGQEVVLYVRTPPPASPSP